MKHDTKVTLAIFAVAIMLGCALVPLTVNETESTVSTNGTIQSNETNDFEFSDLTKLTKLISGMSNGILSHNGVTLVKVDTSGFIKDTISTTIDSEVSVEKNHIATLSTNNGEAYTFNEGGHITVKKGGMLNILPLDDSYTLKIDNKMGLTLEKYWVTLISMEYGSYFSIFGMTFQLLFPKSDKSTISLLSVLGKEDFLLDIGSSSKDAINLNIELKDDEYVEIFGAYKVDHSGFGSFCTLHLSGDVKNENNKFTLTNGKLAISLQYNLSSFGLGYTTGAETPVKISIDTFSYQYDTKIEKQTENETVVKTTGEFSLIASSKGGITYSISINEKTNNNSSLGINVKDMGSPNDVWINTGIVNYTKITKSVINGEDRTLDISLSLLSDDTFTIGCVLPSIIFNTSLSESEKYNADITTTISRFGISGSITCPPNLIINVNGFSLKNEIVLESIDDLYKVIELKMSSDKIDISCNGLLGINLEKTVSKNSGTNRSNLQSTISIGFIKDFGMKICVYDFLMDATESKINMEFDANGTGNIVINGIEKSLSFKLIDFNIDSDTESISLYSFDFETDYPMDKMMRIIQNCSYIEMNASKQLSLTRSHQYNPLNIISLYIEDLELKNHILSADILTLDCRDAEYKGVISTREREASGEKIIRDEYTKSYYGNILVGDISLSIEYPEIKLTWDEISLKCISLNGTIKNPNADPELFKISDNPEIKLMKMKEEHYEIMFSRLDFELVSGKAEFGKAWLPFKLTIDKDATFVADGFKFDSISFHENAAISKNIMVGTKVVRFDDTGDKYVLTHLNPNAYDISMDLSNMDKATVTARNGHYLPKNATGTNYSFSSSEPSTGILTLNGGEMNVDIECEADLYTLSYKGVSVESKDYRIGDKVTLTDKKPTMEGCDFIGWTDSSGSIFFKAESNDEEYVMPARNVELRPVFAPTTTKSEVVDRVQYVDAEDYEVVKIVPEDDVDWIVVKEGKFTVSFDKETLQKLGVTASGLYLKVLKADYVDIKNVKSMKNVEFFDIGLYNGDKTAIDTSSTDAEFYVTVNVKSNNPDFYSLDDCGKMDSLNAYSVNKCRNGTYDVTFKVNELMTFGLKDKSSNDMSMGPFILIIVLVVIMLLCICYFLYDRR